jgi:ADP-ribose pyrophosphatase YjhB (NUDIX family)
MDPLALVGKLVRIAQAGLTYQENPYDQERYAELLEIAADIAAPKLHESVAQVSDWFRGERGYATPKVDVRAVVPQGGKLLFVKESEDGLWSLPGGWADIGSSPAEMAAREVKEETGYDVRVTKLLAVYDKAKHEHPPELWYCYKLFFLCELVGGSAALSLETLDADFFGLDELPALSRRRVTLAQVKRMFEHCAEPGLPADFD